MIALLCTMEPARIAWLPQFVAHYRGIGVERFLLTLQLEPDAPMAERDRDYARFREALAALSIDEGWRWEHEFSGPAVMLFQRALQLELLQPDDWIVWCDSDEFQVYPAPLADMVRQCRQHGVDFVRGVFIDRIAADYGLPAFDPATPLWRTFPRTGSVAASLGSGDPRKVVLARAPVLVRGGKHYLSKGEGLKTISGWVQVHHFKWDATVIERLRYRVRPQWRERFPWWVESQRLLDYFEANDGHFRPADVAPIALSGPHFVAFE